MTQTPRIAIIGLGYVGLPLAVEFGKRFDTLGYDIRAGRVAALRDEARHEYGLEPLGEMPPATYDAVVLAVAHREFAALGTQGIRTLTKAHSIVYDVKHVLPKQDVDGRL